MGGETKLSIQISGNTTEKHSNNCRPSVHLLIWEIYVHCKNSGLNDFWEMEEADRTTERGEKGVATKPHFLDRIVGRTLSWKHGKVGNTAETS